MKLAPDNKWIRKLSEMFKFIKAIYICMLNMPGGGEGEIGTTRIDRCIPLHKLEVADFPSYNKMKESERYLHRPFLISSNDSKQACLPGLQFETHPLLFPFLFDVSCSPTPLLCWASTAQALKLPGMQRQRSSPQMVQAAPTRFQKVLEIPQMWKGLVVI